MGVISFAKSRAALIAATGAFLVAGATATAPAVAQQPTRTAAGAVPAEIAVEMNAKLRHIAPIIRNAEAEHQRMGLPVEQRDRCAAQSVMFARTLAGLKNDETYSYVIAKSDIRDLENMAKFASCTLPGGLPAKLNVCSTEGMLLSGKLSGAVFNPRMIDDRPLAVRCPGGAPQRQASLN